MVVRPNDIISGHLKCDFLDLIRLPNLVLLIFETTQHGGKNMYGGLVTKQELSSELNEELEKLNILSEDMLVINQNINTHLTESASLTKEGHVQLSNATDSDSETLAATPKAVKLFKDELKSLGIGVNVSPITVSDLNDCVSTGTYQFNSSTLNIPPTGTAGGVVRVERRSSNRVWQIVYPTAGGNVINNINCRILGDNGWGEWGQILTSGKFATDAETLAGTSTTKVITPKNLEERFVDYGKYIGTSATAITLDLTHRNKVIGTNSASAITVTIPNDSLVLFPHGTQITFIQRAAGSVTFVPSSGVTLQSKDTKRTIDGLYASATLIRLGANLWALIGALK